MTKQSYESKYGQTGGSQSSPSGSGKRKPKGPVGAILAALAAFGKYAFAGLKLLKGAKFLLTGGTMFLSMWFYSVRFGWPFAVLIVLGILVHELGHVVASAFLGVPVSAPIFIPGFGALIVQKKWAQSAWGEALIGIGGPLGGTLAGMVMWGIYIATGNGLFLGAAFFTFMVNLFNMVPLFPLDGGRIIGAVSPYFWLIGLVLLVVSTFTWFKGNVLIWILVIFSIPHVWSGLKRGTADPVGGQRTTPRERAIMGFSYIALCGFLFAAMSLTMGNIKVGGDEAPARRSGTVGQPL